MRNLYYLLIALASALIAAYVVLWLTKPSPLENTTIPPLIFKQDQSELIIWGGWQMVRGYQAPGINAVEIRCSHYRHATGEDLEARVFNYRLCGGMSLA